MAYSVRRLLARLILDADEHPDRTDTRASLGSIRRPSAVRGRATACRPQAIHLPSIPARHAQAPRGPILPKRLRKLRRHHLQHRFHFQCQSVTSLFERTRAARCEQGPRNHADEQASAGAQRQRSSGCCETPADRPRCRAHASAPRFHGTGATAENLHDARTGHQYASAGKGAGPRA